jgi:hypothetical protein
MIIFRREKKWVTKMLGYEFEIIYKKGKHSVVEDALSRKEEEIEGSLCAIYIPQSDWVEEARIEWNKDHSTTTRGPQFIRQFCMEE